MKNYILTYKEDQSFGGMGFYIEGATLNSDEYNMGTEGLLIAHDIIEHARIKDIGTIGDELKALGAIWFVRGQFGDFPQSIHSSQENIASDVTRMARDFNFNPYFDNPLPNAKYCGESDNLEEIIRIAKKDLRGELDDDERVQENVNKYFEYALSYMIKGYQDAVKRFERIGGNIAANRLFHAIEEQVNQALKWADFEGHQFKLSVDFANTSASIDEYYEEEYY